MPKISDARREERRTQYLDAARRCVSRQGIAGTRMEDITAEAGLSSGSTYLYFSTKDELIRAAIDTSLRQFESAVGGACRRAGETAHDLIAEVLAVSARFGVDTQGVDLYRLAVQGWAFAQTDEQAAALIRQSFGRLLGTLEDALASRSPAAVAASAPETARGLASALISGAVRRALIAELDGEEQLRELEALAAALARKESRSPKRRLPGA